MNMCVIHINLSGRAGYLNVATTLIDAYLAMQKMLHQQHVPHVMPAMGIYFSSASIRQ